MMTISPSVVGWAVEVIGAVGGVLQAIQGTSATTSPKQGCRDSQGCCSLVKIQTPPPPHLPLPQVAVAQQCWCARAPMALRTSWVGGVGLADPQSRSPGAPCVQARQADVCCLAAYGSI